MSDPGTTHGQPVTDKGTLTLAASGSEPNAWTPGPWSVRHSRRQPRYMWVEAPSNTGGGSICTLDEIASDNRVADGRLIAAAPTMAELLLHMIEAIDGGSVDSVQLDGEPEVGIPPHRWHEEWVFYARAAMNKARGLPDDGTGRDPSPPQTASDRSRDHDNPTPTEGVREALACIGFTEDGRGLIINLGAEGIYGLSAMADSEIGPIVIARFKSRVEAALSSNGAGG